MPRSISQHAGFTLVEAIIAMVITGILAGIVAVFIAKPVQGYIDTVRRAELTDMADLALKRMAIEIRTAVPNTVRVDATPYVEFIPTRAGGRYCNDTESCTNPLTDFNPAGGSAGSVTFSVLGPFPTASVADHIIIYNTGQSGLDAYSNNNCSKITGAGADTLTYGDAATPYSFPYASPSSRFFIAPASGPVRFSCSGTQVQRIGGSAGFCGETPTSSTALLVSADSVTCGFTYNAISASNGLLNLSLTLTKSGESVTLRHQIHVDNMP